LNKEILGTFTKFQKATISLITSVCLSIHPHGTTQLTMHRFQWNSIFEYLLEIYQEHSSFIKIWQ